MRARVRARAHGVVALVVATVALSGGCAIPRDHSAQPIDASLLPQLGPARTICPNLSDANPVPVPVYFVTGKEDTRILAPLQRDVDRPITPQGALQRLLECPPTPDEQRQGYTTVIPLTTLEGFREIDRGVYEIQLSSLRSRDGEEIDELNKLAVAQIVFTVTNSEFPVEGVTFRIGGELKAASTDGATKAPGEAVTRDDFTLTQPTTTTSTTAPPPPTTEAQGDATMPPTTPAP